MEQSEFIMALQELPTAVLHCIAMYIPDGVTLCHFEATCRNVRAAVESTIDPWNILYYQRWSYLNDEPLLDKRAYAQRHLKDQQARKLYQSILHRSAAASSASADDDLKDDTDEEELRGLYALGKEVLGVFWTFHDQATSMKDRERIHTILTHLQFSAIMTEVVVSIHSQQPKSPDIRIEELALLTSLLGSGAAHRNFDHFAQEVIRDPLERMAQSVRTRLAETSTATSTTAEIFQTLNQVFFREQGFSGNVDDYYDFENSLLHCVLHRKRAIPMTLAVVYKCVARRLDLEVDIVGLPGHIVVGIPSLGCHVDVFHGGRVLQMEDLAAICNNYGFPFREEFLTPLSPEDTLARICKNMMNCIARDEGDDTEADETSSLRLLTVVLIGMALREPGRTEMILEKCHMGLLRRWDRQFGRVVDEFS